MKNQPQILFEGMLSPKNIDIRVEESNLFLNDEIEKRIEKIWEEKLVESRNKGNEIFNGISYRLNNWSTKNNHLQLVLSTFDYKHRIGLITMLQQNELDETEYIQGGCFVGSTVLTADGKYILATLSGKSMNDNFVEILGGIVETDVTFSNGDFLFDVLYKELEEEAGIKKTDISECHLRLFFSGTNAHFGFYFETKLSITSTELIKRFQTNTDVDIASLLFSEKSEYLKKLASISETKKLIAQSLGI